MTHDCDLAIVGSGFGASVLAMIARRLGLRVMLLERGRHPRFAIGESASPLAGILIEQLSDAYDLPRLKPLAAFGTWQRAYPDVVCGLKRGFTYFKHEPHTQYRAAPDRSNQLLVAASPSNELSDTHWLRSDVDYFLLREAIALGAEYVDQVQLTDLEWAGVGSPVLRGQRADGPVRVRAGFVVDASGARGFLARALGLATNGFDDYPPTQALFSHFIDVARCDAMSEYAVSDAPPYPIDDAALHHVFDEGWMWVLRFGNGVTSAGVAVTDRLAADLRLADGEDAWPRLLARYPTVAEQFAEATPIREFTWMPRLPYRTSVASGERWCMLPSAAAFIDPLFSTGIPLTLLGIERIARLLAAGSDRSRWDDHAAVTLAEADHTARFIAGCYAAFPRFEAFTAYSMFYFAAASFSEMARRIHGGGPRGRFLCSDDAAFGAATLRLSPACLGYSDSYAAAVGDAIEPRNIAGLCDAAKRNWYDIDPEDTIRAAAKLGATSDEVREMLIRAGALEAVDGARSA